MSRAPVSLKAWLRNAFLIMLFYIIVLTAVYLLVNQRITARFEASKERSGSFSELLLEQSRLKSSFETALRGTETLYREDFFSLNEEIEALSSRLLRQSGGRRVTLGYLRVIRRMNAYQRESSTHILGKSSLQPEDYAELSFLNLLYDELIGEAQALAIFENERNSREYADFYTRAKRGEYTLFLLLGLLFIFTALFVLSRINRIFSGMNRLIQAAGSFSEGKLTEPDIPGSPYTELDTIGGAFNRMKHDINRYVSDLKQKSRIELELHQEHLENERKDRLLKQAQLNFLIAQVNPHFLFNALNIIGKAAVLQDADKSLELIEAVSRIMRYSLEHPGELVPLREEMEVVQSYLLIQKSRYQERLKIEVAVSAATEEMLIPPMIIQPLVENSIKHGIDSGDGKLSIAIRSELSSGRLRIQIEDNGPGIADLEDALESDGIGLKNLRQRLSLRYGREDLLNISSPAGTGSMGTKISIHIPELPEL